MNAAQHQHRVGCKQVFSECLEASASTATALTMCAARCITIRHRSSWGGGWEFLQEGKDCCKWKTLRNLASSQGIKSTYEVEASTTAAVPASVRKRLK